MKVLVVEDDTVTRKIVVRAVEEAGHDCVECASGEEAWELFQADHFEVVVSDWFMPGMDGLELCQSIRATSKKNYTYFILLTVAQGKHNIQRAMQEGIDDFLPKPLDFDELRVRLLVASRITRLQQDAAKAAQKITLLEEQGRVRRKFHGMVGTCPEIQEVFRRIRLAAESNVSVFVFGESGTGKELAAGAIHALSNRKDEAFLAVNCGALPETILESELFGHVQGAFTGAHRDKQGLFELAHKGTLFLDEIGDVSLLLQQKLLRALEAREIRRVGDDHFRKVDVRIIAATNQDLKELVAAGTFREDLYYRVRVFQIDLPPLRVRRGDISLLVEHFMRDYRESTGKKIEKIEDRALRMLMEYSWRGNVRELRNAIEHAFVTVPGDVLRVEDFPPEIREVAEFNGRGPVSKEEEARRVIEALEATGGNRTAAAEDLGISRVALWKKIRRLGLQDDIPPPSRAGRRRKKDSGTS